MSAQSENAMDEVQFNASLDALLAGESMNVNDGGSSNTYPMMNSQSANGWLSSSGSAAAMSHAMNLQQPSDPVGLGAMSLPAHHTNHSSSLPPTNYFPTYLVRIPWNSRTVYRKVSHIEWWGCDIGILVSIGRKNDTIHRKIETRRGHHYYCNRW